MINLRRGMTLGNIVDEALSAHADKNDGTHDGRYAQHRAAEAEVWELAKKVGGDDLPQAAVMIADLFHHAPPKDAAPAAA